MKTNTKASWPSILPERSLTTQHKNKLLGQRPGVIKLQPAVPRPDESFVKKMNELAAQAPFCRTCKARPHDIL